jgi:hypothetical protein
MNKPIDDLIREAIIDALKSIDLAARRCEPLLPKGRLPPANSHRFEANCRLGETDLK